MAEALFLKDLASKSGVCERLSFVFGPGLHSSKAALLLKCGDRLREEGISSETGVVAYWVPGRIEVLGKHTDYAGGRSLLAASERGFVMVAAARSDSGLEAIDALSGESTSFEIEPSLLPVTTHWPNFPMTVARRLANNFGEKLSGAHIAFASDLPRASGMSSSSAMLIGFSLVLLDLNQLAKTPEFKDNIAGLESLAGYLATVENGQSFGSLTGDRGVGTFGGSEDHTAILCCRGNELSQYSFCPVRFERQIVLGDDLTFAVGVSGVSADKTGEAMTRYNRASRLAAEASRMWREATGYGDLHLAAAIVRSKGSLQPVLQALQSAVHPEFGSAELLGRVNQFHQESDVILPTAGDALQRRDLEQFGRLVDRSQSLAESYLKNQVPQTVFLAKCARRLGAVAASAFGAGFGGSVWALVNRREGGEFLEEWEAQYLTQFPDEFERSSFFVTRPGPAARPVHCSPKTSILEALSSGR